MLVPVPCIASGIITSTISNSETYEVSVYESPVGELNGPIYVTLIYGIGGGGNYKQGTRVKVLITLEYDISIGKYIGVHQPAESFILGTFAERAVISDEVENPLTQKSEDVVRFINEKSQAGVTITDNGHLTLASGGAISTVLKSYGYAVDENAIHSIAQNFHRIIGFNAPFYLSREYFGLYRGFDKDDKLSRTTEDDFFINYRRFVQQTKSLDKFVSTCEGTYAPMLGPNNSTGTVAKGKEVLFSKIINYETSRATIEIGEPGEEFMQIRIDDVKVNERQTPTSPGASPAVLGNRLKILIGDDGSLDIKTGGDGTPTTNKHAFHMSVDTKGNLTIHAKGKIELSHGDNDAKINSIIMDPDKGIDLRAVNGVRINEQEVVLSPFVDWMNTFQKTFGIATTPGGPVPIHPVALVDFKKGYQLPGLQNGFTSKGVGPNATGLIIDTDNFSSV